MSAAMGGPAPREGDRIELRGGRLVDVVHGRYFPPEVRIVMRRGVIEAMPGLPGQPGRVGADLVADLGGRAVTPGLFNTHCHVQFVTPALALGVGDPRRILRHRRAQIRFGMSDCLSRGITVVRDALVENLGSSRKLRSSISRGEIPGPRIEQAILVCPLGGAFAPVVSPVEGLVMSLAGLPPVDYESDRSGIVVFPPGAGPAGVRDAVTRAAGERGAGCIKFYDQREKKISFRPGAVMMTQRQLDAAADQARRLGLRTTLHHLTVESFRRGIRAGVSSLARPAMDGEARGAQEAHLRPRRRAVLDRRAQGRVHEGNGEGLRREDENAGLHRHGSCLRIFFGLCRRGCPEPPGAPRAWCGLKDGVRE
jgi:imidazolonepropionase-like amidohydrolase